MEGSVSSRTSVVARSSGVGARGTLELSPTVMRSRRLVVHTVINAQ